MKKLKLNLSGAKELNREQQRSINGGSGTIGDCEDDCNSDEGCSGEQVCICLKVESCYEINHYVARCVYPG